MRPFNAVYTPDPREIFNPPPIGIRVDPCLRRERPESYPDFTRISEVIRSPNFTDLFGEKKRESPTIRHVDR
jgi:hypothetical protein